VRIAKADDGVENLRPVVLARLWIDFHELRRTRPELATVSIPGFASDDQLRREGLARLQLVVAAAPASSALSGRSR